MVTLRGTWMRGDTSKCWLFNAVDVVRGIQLPDFGDPRVHRATPAEAVANAPDDQKIWNDIFGYNE